MVSLSLLLLFLRSIQEEEEEAHKKYLAALKQDEILAKQMQRDLPKSSLPQSTSKSNNIRGSTIKPRLKATKIDGFLSKKQIPKCKK